MEQNANLLMACINYAVIYKKTATKPSLVTASTKKLIVNMVSDAIFCTSPLHQLRLLQSLAPSPIIGRLFMKGKRKEKANYLYYLSEMYS
jgi:hypothetical protein